MQIHAPRRIQQDRSVRGLESTTEQANINYQALLKFESNNL